MESFDAIIVGSGINSLVCAAMLARRKRRVCVLEREAVLGGCIRTEALTAPGYLHDTLSAAHPLFVTGPAYADLGEALHGFGLAYCKNDTPTGVLLPDGRHLILSTSREKNVARFETLAAGDGHAYQAAMQFVERHSALIFTLLGAELKSWPAARAVATASTPPARSSAHPCAADAPGWRRRSVPTCCAPCWRPGRCIAGWGRKAPCRP